MKAGPFLLVGTSVLATCVFWACRRADAEPVQGRVVRIAELEIDPAQVEAYKSALNAEIEASVRVEAGVLALYAVAVKGHPEQIRILEIYADTAAYQTHLQTPHFLKYKASTQGMVKALKLIETDPIVLGSKMR